MPNRKMSRVEFVTAFTRRQELRRQQKEVETAIVSRTEDEDIQAVVRMRSNRLYRKARIIT